MTNILRAMMFIPLIFLETISFSVERIVSLSPSVTESIYTLGEGNKLVGVTSFCIYPAEAARKEKIGTIIEPNVEKIVLLKPDLVLGSSINRPELVKKLQSLGVTVTTFQLDRNYKDICDNFLKLGKLLGKEPKAVSIIAQSNKRLTIIKERLRKIKRLKVLWVVGTNPLIVAGNGSFPNEIIKLAGGINIADNINLPYSRYNKEDVLLKNPDVMIFISMGELTKSDLDEWKQYKQINAVKQDRIYTIDAHLVSTPVPTVFAQGVEETAKCIHPEVFKK